MSDTEMQSGSEPEQDAEEVEEEEEEDWDEDDDVTEDEKKAAEDIMRDPKKIGQVIESASKSKEIITSVDSRRIYRSHKQSAKGIAGIVLRAIAMQEWKAEKRNGIFDFSDTTLMTRLTYCLTPEETSGYEPALLPKQAMQKSYDTLMKGVYKSPTVAERAKKFAMSASCQRL